MVKVSNADKKPSRLRRVIQHLYPIEMKCENQEGQEGQEKAELELEDATINWKGREERQLREENYNERRICRDLLITPW